MKYFKILLLVLVAISCTKPRSHTSQLQEWMETNGKLKVLCTTAMIADLVKEVGKDKIDCLTLIQGQSDPHSYQLVKGDDEKLKVAELLFYNGLGLEHGPSLAERLTNSSKAFSIAGYIGDHYPDDIIVYNGTVDPHVWMDVALWTKALPFITDKLAKALPEEASFFEKNAEALRESLEKLNRQIIERFLQVPLEKRYIVSAHEAFNYFVRAYLATDEERKNGSWTVRSMAPEGLAPDSQLSTADIQRLVNHIVAYKVTTLFAESNISQDSLKKLTDACVKKGYMVHIAHDPLYVDAMGPPGSKADRYMGMLEYDSETIAKGLTCPTQS
ncbi:MAG: zinc ABC transporter substrate-binding protein [Verrucomicrobia bacterium]|nr:zinc ABC transporter substrate-binding protein [Verrucomicrobiota bacterium]